MRKPPVVEKLGGSLYRLGTLRVDTAAREVTVPGKINEVTTLEFMANAIDGVKAYESAITMDTDGITLNTALLLIGLEPAHGKAPKGQFDPSPAGGDPVDISVTWGKKRVKLDDLVFDRRSNRPLARGSWVYTGSTFIDAGDGTGRHFMAEVDGILFGLMHGPSAIIERVEAPTGYGALVRNTALDVKPGAPVTVIIKALPATGR